MDGVNWGKLVKQGRAKAPGMPWTQEELDAIHIRGMSVEEVRAGKLFPQDKKPSVKSGPKSLEETLEELPMADLTSRAKDLGILFSPDAVSRGDLILEIKKKLKAKLKSNTSKNPK